MNLQSELDEPFREACCNGNTEVVYKLLNSGIDVNSQNKVNGWTGLHWAAKRGHGCIISALLKNNADPSINNFNGESAVDVSKNENTRAILQNKLQSKSEVCANVNKNDETKKVNSNTSDDTHINFIPNYLLNPVFPHLQQNIPENMDKPSNRFSNDNLLLHSEMEQTINTISNDENELVLKVRVIYSSDFIEVELNLNELTYDNLLNVCCDELNVNKVNVIKIRKLPNTILRKDKDVRRLKQFQELELVVDYTTSS